MRMSFSRRVPSRNCSAIQSMNTRRALQAAYRSRWRGQTEEAAARKSLGASRRSIRSRPPTTRPTESPALAFEKEQKRRERERREGMKEGTRSGGQHAVERHKEPPWTLLVGSTKERCRHPKPRSKFSRKCRRPKTAPWEKEREDWKSCAATGERVGPRECQRKPLPF